MSLVLDTVEVQNLLQEQGVPAELFGGLYPSFALSDRKWHTCSKSFALRNWTAWRNSLPDVLRHRNETGGTVPVWRPEFFDCDNHAQGCATHAFMGNALRAMRDEKWLAAGLLFGLMYYVAEYKPENKREGAHAINWHVDHNKRLRFFEPAEGRHVWLTEKELASIFFGSAC